MRTGKRVIAVVVAAVVGLAGTVLAVEPAVAGSSTANYYYPGGDRLEARIYMDAFADSNGCGYWQTSAWLWGNNPPYAAWIRNTAAFSANGLGASIYAFSAGEGGSSVSASWTNDDDWIADLAGTLCSNWLTLWVSGTSTATSYVPQYGSPRSATAAV